MGEACKLRFVKTNDDNIVFVDRISEKGYSSTIGIIRLLDQDIPTANSVIPAGHYVYFEILNPNDTSARNCNRHQPDHDVSFESLKDRILGRYKNKVEVTS